MYTCANCAALACRKADREPMPANCPMRNTSVQERAFARYGEEACGFFFGASAAVEAEGYGVWPRLREVAEFCERMKYRKVGMAFCSGLHREAKVIDRILRKRGLEVVSVICKTGGISKERAGIPEEHKIHPGEFEAMCNPIAQAKLLNEQCTQFNIVVGLCVGHDSLFYKHSDALVTTLIAKDRVLAHNPAGAIYCAEGYFRDRLAPEPVE